MNKLRLAVAGVGNCASSLMQGFEYYQRRGDSVGTAGLLHAAIGGYRLSDIEVVAAFDIDRRKVGRFLEEAVFAPPNCTTVFQRELPASGVTVQMAPVLDGLAEHMKDYSEDRAFRVSEANPVDVTETRRKIERDLQKLAYQQGDLSPLKRPQTDPHTPAPDPTDHRRR